MDHVYVISRRDLPSPHQTVQISHGAIAASLAFGSSAKPHPNLVVLAVDDEPALLQAFEKLKAANVPCCLWREEDLDGQATAIGTAPLKGEQRRALRRYKLLS